MLTSVGRRYSLTNTAEMRVEPIRKQRSVGFPAGVRMSNAFAHNESGGHFRLIQTLEEPTRLLNRYGFVA